VEGANVSFVLNRVIAAVLDSYYLMYVFGKLNKNLGGVPQSARIGYAKAMIGRAVASAMILK